MLRVLVVAVMSSLAATAAVAVTVRESSAAVAVSCGLWDYCFCMELDCYMGDQLCASGPGFECYQWD